MGVTLLLADDSITIQRVIELTFADENIRVIAASDGQAAIQKIDAERPDIVLADVGMPKVDGYGVAAHVKQTPALRHIPVLLLTGAFEPIDEARARGTGCDGILVKPFEPQLLIERVRELLAGQRSDALWPADLPRVEAPATPAPVAPPPSAPPAERVAPPAPVLVVTPPAAPRAVRDSSPTLTPPPSRPVLVPAPVAAAPADGPGSMQQEMLRPASRNPQQQPPMSRTQLVQRDLPPPADAFESELDMLDVALSRLEPTASPHELDAATASDFARDLAALRSEPADAEAAPGSAGASGATMFGEWDLPAGHAARAAAAAATGPGAEFDRMDRMDRYDLADTEAIDVVPEEVPAETSSAPPATPLPAPTRVFIAPPAPPPPAPVPPPVVELVFEKPVEKVADKKVVAMPVAVPAPPPAPRPSLANAFSALLAAERAQPPARALAASTTLSEAAIEDVVKRVLARMTDEAVHKVVLDAAERIIREEIEQLKSPKSSGH